MNREEIETLRRLEAEATPGPWRSLDSDGAAPEYPHRHVKFGIPPVGMLPRLSADPNLIVAMRNALPELLRIAEEHRRLVSALEWLKNVEAFIDAESVAGDMDQVISVATQLGWRDDQ